MDDDPELAAALALSLEVDTRESPLTSNTTTATTTQVAPNRDALGTPSGQNAQETVWRANGLERFAGRYVRRPTENAWHSGNITLSVQNRLRWDNDAGVGWSLTPPGGGSAAGPGSTLPQSLITGETNPYVETQPAFLGLVWRPDGALESFVFGDDVFSRDAAAIGGAGGGARMGGRQVELDHAVALLSTNPLDVIHETEKILQKLLGNVVKHPGSDKFRTVKKGNPKIAAVLAVPGATEFLRACGFRDTAEALTIAPHNVVEGVLVGAQRSLTNVATNAEAGFRGHTDVPNGHYRCSACRRVICNDDTIDFTGGGGMHLPQGEFKYACHDCDDYQLCRKCFDSFREGRLPHDPTHSFDHVPPKTNEWGWGRGAPPPPPPPNARNAGGWPR